MDQLFASLGTYFLHTGLWATLIVGLVAGVLTLVMGNSLMGPRRWAVAQPVPATLAPPRVGGSVQLESSRYLFVSLAERRTAPRRSGSPVKVMLTPTAARGETVEAYVRDRSVGGLGLATHEPLKPGTILSVRPVEAPVTAPSVLVEVRHCSLRDNLWFVGCQFQDTPSWGVMLLFG